MLIIEANVYTSCTNDDNENKCGHALMSIGYYCMQQYSHIRDEIGGSGGHTLMVRGQHPGSSSGPPRDVPCFQCASLAVVRMTCHHFSFVPIDDMTLLCRMLCYC